MEKVINIGGKNVALKSTAGTPRRYKAQFKSDYFSDLLKLAKTFDVGKNNQNEFSLSDFSWETLDHLNFDTIFNFIWALAKTADPSIPNPETWFDTFETFPIMEILPEVTDLLSSSIQTTKK
ncbi:hypothetical protein ACWODG_05575 [Enterococcus italicus]